MSRNHSSELQLQFGESSRSAEVQRISSSRGLSVQFSRIRLPSEYAYSWDGRLHYVAHHDLVLDDGCLEVLGEKPVRSGDLRDFLTFLPAGHSARGWASPATGRLHSFTVLCFDLATIQEEVEMDFGTGACVPRIHFRHGQIARTMRKLGSLMEQSGERMPRLQAEALGMVAALEILSVARPDHLAARKAGTFSRPQRKLIMDFIGEHFAEDVSLDELASLAGLSRYHFSRVFKETFGETPHRFVILQRIARARELLVVTGLPVAQIAEACGFHGMTQFGRSFRAIEGISPLQYRKAARSN